MTRSNASGTRILAIAALAAAGAAIAVALGSLWGDLGRLGVFALALIAALTAAWIALTHTRAARWAASLAGVACVAVAGAVMVTAGSRGLGLVVSAALGIAAAALGRRALGSSVGMFARPPGTEAVAAARHGVVIINLRSGGGKAARCGLEEACHQRGIETICLRPGDDLRALAQGAIDAGADVLGMAGGDGSQALVASVAMASDVAVVCVPAGTRNHFALDLGLDRDDVLGALDAFDDALERRIDLAAVGDRVFVNNVSLGLYAEIVQADGYREAKRRTTQGLLPELLGPSADPFDLHFPGPDGSTWDGAHVLQVSNNPYVLTRRSGFGGRPRLDTGELGIAVLTLARTARSPRASRGRIARRPVWAEWSAPELVVDSGDAIAAGVDGEALLLPPPLSFTALPGALRVRLPRSAPGRSPAAMAMSPWASGRALVRIALGR